MKKIIFSGICMLISAAGIISILFIVLKLHETLGSLNGSTSMMVYLDWLNITPIFTLFILLGISGFVIGLWGVFESYIERIMERKGHNAKI